MHIPKAVWIVYLEAELVGHPSCGAFGRRLDFFVHKPRHPPKDLPQHSRPHRPRSRIRTASIPRHLTPASKLFPPQSIDRQTSPREQCLPQDHPRLQCAEFILSLLSPMLNITICSNYQTAWSKALEHLQKLSPKNQKYYDRLSTNEKALLQKGTTPDEMLQLLQKEGKSKHSCFTGFNDKVAKPFVQFQDVFQVAVSTCGGIGAPIWAPMTLVLKGCPPPDPCTT